MTWYEKKGLEMNGGVSLPYYPTGGKIEIRVKGGKVAPELDPGYHYTVKCSIRDEITEKAYLSVNDTETGERVAHPKRYPCFGEEIEGVTIIAPEVKERVVAPAVVYDDKGNQYTPEGDEIDQ